MYRINKHENKIAKLEQKTFKDLDFKEREHLQEWLCTNPSALGEELLIIQKEFDGFPDTYERLDLLALDKQGDLVVIENKLDDSGRDVTWQVLKYVSYCSTLSKEDIKKIYESYLRKFHSKASAEELISEFYDGNDYEEIILNQGNTQRIIMVAANFRKEVTSTVLWLHNFKIRIQCFQVTPFAMGDELFLNIDQILPLKDTLDYTISMSSKTQEEVASKKNKSEINERRYEFWAGLLEKAKGHLPLFNNISPTEYNWISASSGCKGVAYTFWVTRDSVTIRLYIDLGKGKHKENLEVFNHLFSYKDEIEAAFGGPLVWQEMANYRACVILKNIPIAGYMEKEKWNQVYEESVGLMIKFIKAFNSYIKEISH